MADNRLPPSLPNVGAVRERFESSMREVRRQVDLLRSELISLEVYAREQSGEVRGHYVSTPASKAYDDMADRIRALRGDDG